MKTKHFIILFFLFSWSSWTVAVAQRLPNIHILATGGTIAGTGNSATGSNYSAGQIAINELISAVPELKEIARITGEQIVKIGSQDMSDEVCEHSLKTSGCRWSCHYTRNRYHGRNSLLSESDCKKQ